MPPAMSRDLFPAFEYMFIICRISKGRVHTMARLLQGYPRETVDGFFMIVFFSLDIARPVCVAKSAVSLCSCNNSVSTYLSR